MTRTDFPKTKQVLVFNDRRILTLIASSANEAARYKEMDATQISKVCHGRMIAHKHYYYRYIDNNVEIELSDIGTLTLEEYDQLCDQERKVYATRKMKRNNCKTTKQ